MCHTIIIIIIIEQRNLGLCITIRIPLRQQQSYQVDAESNYGPLSLSLSRNMCLKVVSNKCNIYPCTPALMLLRALVAGWDPSLQY